MLFAALLFVSACALRQDSHSLYLYYPEPNATTSVNLLPGDVVADGFRIRKGSSIPIPGELGEDGNALPLQWQIEHYLALLRNETLFEKYAVGDQHHHAAEFLGVDYGARTVPPQVRDAVTRHTLVMKIWIMQALRGLEMGRLSVQMRQYFFDNTGRTRAYLEALLKRMYVAFGHLIYRITPMEQNFGSVRHVDPPSDWRDSRVSDRCAETHFEKIRGFFVVNLGRDFQTYAQQDVRDWDMRRGTKAGVLLHQVSHLVLDEDITTMSAPGWPGDVKGTECGDDGRLGTHDYAYGKEVFHLSSREARHNADSIQFFIEASVLAEVDAGHAIEITPSGEVRPPRTKPDLAFGRQRPCLLLLVGLGIASSATA